MTTSPASGADRLPLPAHGALHGDRPTPFAASCALLHTTSNTVAEVIADLQLLAQVGLSADQLAAAERIHATAAALHRQAHELSLVIARAA